MQVAITGMEHIRNNETVFGTELINGLEDPWQRRTWHHTVLEVVAGVFPAKGRDGTFTAFPEKGTILFTAICVLGVVATLACTGGQIPTLPATARRPL